jgi:bifunctional non-homologous end joining protein LigD
MPLDEYKKKRNFQKSPEPAGAPPPGKARGAPLFFCVQKHLASQLHYDFRLEWNGVLLSWAVPKGPSLDPRDKRLAMHVEDHPIEYGTFEGVIPEGYGAGIVMLWDRGTWEPDTVDVDAALRKGDLKFRLDGFKLKGSWVLVRTRGYTGRGPAPDPSRGPQAGSDRSWLLIKHRDEWSGPLDITEFAPHSVKTPEADLADILAADNPDVWRSNRPAKTGDTGKMFEKIIARALEIREARAGSKDTKDTKGTKDAKGTKDQPASTQQTATASKPLQRKASEPSRASRKQR